jgi:PhoPQ-activated pathogenicity-related protein
LGLLVQDGRTAIFPFSIAPNQGAVSDGSSRRKERIVFARVSITVFAIVYFVTGFLAGPATPLHAADAQNRPLLDYVKKPDASYHWVKVAEGNVGPARVAELVLTSQTWKDIVWKHRLFVIKPNNVNPQGKNALLMITGGAWNPKLEQAGRKLDPSDEVRVLALMSAQLRAPAAVLMDVPFQPIFDGKYEDAIIAYTFDKFLQTHTADWPLLLPMVKTAVRAMDAVQEFSKKEWSLDIARFTVAGASKRGWTTWLTGAADGRAAAIIPMVIDTLNMKPQAKLQLLSFGSFSVEIKDYTERNLQARMNGSDGQALRDIIDPYSYLDMLKLPKLLMMGTNDPYWPLEAANLYWRDLLGEKYILYVPNNGHGLEDLTRVVGSVLAFQEHVALGKPFPKLKWAYDDSPTALRLTIESDLKPKSVVAWTAASKSRDFRESKWTSQPAHLESGKYRVDLPVPASGYSAIFGEAVFSNGAIPYFLSTNVRVVGKNAKVPAAAKRGS